ncbi:MAG: universal stress protein [Desulfovibrionales bacterium]
MNVVDIHPVSISKILYATDLSENAGYALNYAVDLAEHYGAQMVFLHVLDEVPDTVDKWVVGYLPADRWETIKKEYEEETLSKLSGKKGARKVFHEMLDSLREQIRPAGQIAAGKEDVVRVRRGNPVSKILETAKEESCDLIIMGTHGHGTFLDSMMGSTANRVSKRAKVPVMIIPLPKS